MDEEPAEPPGVRGLPKRLDNCVDLPLDICSVGNGRKTIENLLCGRNFLYIMQSSKRVSSLSAGLPFLGSHNHVTTDIFFLIADPSPLRPLGSRIKNSLAHIDTAWFLTLQDARG